MGLFNFPQVDALMVTSMKSNSSKSAFTSLLMVIRINRKVKFVEDVL